MPILETIGCQCGKCLFNEASQVLKGHFGYLLDYKKNLKNLEDEKTEFEKQRAKINEKVEDATTCGEDILNEVSEWLENADSKKQELDAFLVNETPKENLQCFNRFWCPNFKWRYRLSKQAEEMKVNVKKLTDEAGKFDTVSRPKPPPMETIFPSVEGYQEFNSRDLVFSSIVDALRDSEVKIVGVYGQGGVGKTTIVQKVGEHVKKNGLFDEVVEAVVSRPQNVRDIQQQIAGGLYPKLVFDLGSDQKERAGQLMNRLNNGKKNLIILDDIWDKLENLNVIGIPITDGNKGCKLVLTSRDRDNWKNMQVHCRDFPINLLSDSEAWDLFKRKVGNISFADEICLVGNSVVSGVDVAQVVCQECRGLPVAIIAIGAALKDRDLNAWKYALRLLENSIIDQKLYTSLKLSYDLLQSEDAKSIFLLCCLFPEDADISIDEDLTRHCVARRLLDLQPETLEDARVVVRTVVGTLKTSCLLLEGSDKCFVKMHDVIRDVAVSICKLELGKPIVVKDGVQEWPEKGMYSAILLRKTLIKELPDELVCPQLHTLQLERSFDWDNHDYELLTVPANFFSAMEKLNILDLCRICMPSSSSSSSLAKLVNLRMLRLIECKLTDASILRDLKKSLEILILGGWNANHLLPEVGRLISLRSLDLRECYNNLKVIPPGVISKLTRLEELYIPDSFDQWEGTTADDMERSNASLVELSLLTRLTCLYIHIPNAATLPKDFRGFQKLIRFRISVGGKIASHEDNQEIIKSSTRFLKLSGITLEEIDQFSDLLDRAEVLYLEKLQSLMKLIHNRGGVWFLKVKCLSVQHCDDLAYLFSSSWPKGTPQLQRLEITNCQNIEKIVGIEEGKDEDVVVNFSHLKCIVLQGLPNLISFYPRMKKIEGNSSTRSHPLFNGKVTFPALEELVICELPNIREIWDEKLLPEIAAESCPKLTVMKVFRCEKYVHVVPSTMLSLLQKIRELHVVDCPMMEVIISDKAIEKKPVCNDVIVFHQLRDLKLWNLPNLKSFCNSNTTSEAPLAIFNHRVAFPELTKLILIDCYNFGYLSPHLFGRLQKLEKLIVSNCDWVNEQLNVVEGQHDGLLTDQLEEIVLDNLPQLTGLWNRDPHGMQGLRNLKRLIIWNCPILKYLFTSSVAMALKRLEGLCLASCVIVEEVIVATHEEEEEGDKAQVIDEIVFPELKYLYLLDMPNLKSFCSANCNFNLQSLTTMVINRCPKLQTFTPGVIHMPPQITINEIERIGVDDFNNFLQQQLLEGEFNGGKIYSKFDLCGEKPFQWVNFEYLMWLIC